MSVCVVLQVLHIVKEDLYIMLNISLLTQYSHVFDASHTCINDDNLYQ